MKQHPLNGVYPDSKLPGFVGGRQRRTIAESLDRMWERSVSSEDNGADVALTSSEQELRLVVETIPALVWRAGPEGNFEYVNKRVLEYFGAPLDEIIGWGWMEKVHPDDVAFKVKTCVAANIFRTSEILATMPGVRSRLGTAQAMVRKQAQLNRKRTGSR